MRTWKHCVTHCHLAGRLAGQQSKPTTGCGSSPSWTPRAGCTLWSSYLGHSWQGHNFVQITLSNQSHLSASTFFIHPTITHQSNNFPPISATFGHFQGHTAQFPHLTAASSHSHTALNTSAMCTRPTSSDPPHMPNYLKHYLHGLTTSYVTIKTHHPSFPPSLLHHHPFSSPVLLVMIFNFFSFPSFPTSSYQ